MELALTACQFCEKAPFKYTCPKCNALYCGNSCYRKPEHRKCTSSFFNIFNQSSSYSQGARNDVIMRYVALRNSLEIENKTIPERAESESSMESESKSIWTNDDYVPPRMVTNDSDSDDDSYPYYDYDYYSYDDDDHSNDDGDELNDGDDSNNNDNDDRDDSNDNDNYNDGDHSNVDSNAGDDGRNHLVENSNADSNNDADGGISIKDGEDSNNNDDDNEFDLNALEVD